MSHSCVIRHRLEFVFTLIDTPTVYSFLRSRLVLTGSFLDVASLCGKFSSHPQGIYSFLRSSLDVVSPPRLVLTGSLLDVASLCGKFSSHLVFTFFHTHIAYAFLTLLT